MGKSQYIIQFGGLPVGLHEFEFDVNDTFFSKIENSEIQKAELKVNALLTKQNNLLQLHFDIVGTIGVDCDRCLKYFDYPVDASEDLVIKHGQPSESTDEILVIAEGQDEFDVSHYLYEYIILAIPARRVPCELDETRFRCDYDVLDKLTNLAAEPDEGEEPNNPIWEQLNKIKFNKN
ncbi:MAG: DUF177 domain-containing protein [bacterium]|nr:DUF177 domain-containing protein [bacterium]